MNKVGSELTKRVQRGNPSAQRAEEEKPAIEKEAEVYARFDSIMADTCEKFTSSTRTKLLIKNMLADKATGWKKVGNQNEKLKTKE